MREYTERLEVCCEAHRPVSFSWRRQEYRVSSVVEQWRERTDWWRSLRQPQGQPFELEQLVWRVEAHRRSDRHAGVYDLRCEADGWTLLRALD